MGCSNEAKSANQSYSSHLLSPTHPGAADNRPAVDEGDRLASAIVDLDLEDVDGSTFASDSEDGREGPSRDIDRPRKGVKDFGILQRMRSASL